MTEQDQRARLIAEALTWLATPYHCSGRIKGAGADCLTFIVCAAQNAGILGPVDIPAYSSQFGLHRSEETYLKGLLDHAHEVEAPLPGDVVLWKFGRVHSHAALVVDWPQVIHAQTDCGVTLDDAEKNQFLALLGGRPRPRKFLSYW